MRLLKKGRSSVGPRDESVVVSSSESERAHRFKEGTEKNSNSCGLKQNQASSASRTSSIKGFRKALRRKHRQKNSKKNPNRIGGMGDEENAPPFAQSSDSPSQDQEIVDNDSFSSPQQDRTSLQSQKFSSSAEMAILHHSYTNEEEMEPSPPSRLSERKTQSFRPTIEAALSSRMVNDTRSEYCERRWQSIGEGALKYG